MEKCGFHWLENALKSPIYVNFDLSFLITSVRQNNPMKEKQNFVNSINLYITEKKTEKS